MSYLRRRGVIADYGSLEAYKAFLTEARNNSAVVLDMNERTAITDADHAYVDECRLDLADWNVDLEWVNAELAKDAK